MPSTEVGHHPKRVYLHQDGRLVVPSSATILVEGSTKSNANSGASIINRNIGLTTQRTSDAPIPADGVSIICTTAVGTLLLAHPIKGIEKTLIWASTASTKVKVRLSKNQEGKTIKIRGVFGKVNPTKGATVIFPSSDFEKAMTDQKYAVPAAVTLLGYSTNTWIITNLTPGECTGIKYWTLATGT
jgi:hypothetical protein